MAKKGQFKSGASKRSKAQRKYNSQPDQKKRRAQRNAARRKAVREGRAKKGDGKDVHHPNASPSGKLPKKTKVIGRSKNRSMNRRRRK